MLIQLRTVPLGRSKDEQNVELSPEQKKNSGCNGDVLCRATIDRFPIEIHVKIVFQCVIDVECARCLEVFKENISGSFRVILKGKSRSADDDDVESDFFYTDDDLVVDVTAALYDEIMVSVPMMPVCGEKCDGGGMVVEGEKEIDPRWEALKKIKR